MKIVSAKFATSIANANQLPAKNYPEIAFAGRSNVGKSSLINCLLNRKKLALTSSSPGKTRLLNFFEVNERLYFVDLPGYGFAKVSQTEREQWKKLIETYINKSQNLKGIIQIIDSRIGPTELDTGMIEWLSYLNKQIILIATKTDKLPKSKMKHIISLYSEKLKIYGVQQIIPFSAIKKTGKKETWQAIQTLIEKTEK